MFDLDVEHRAGEAEALGSPDLVPAGPLQDLQDVIPLQLLPLALQVERLLLGGAGDNGGTSWVEATSELIYGTPDLAPEWPGYQMAPQADGRVDFVVMAGNEVGDYQIEVLGNKALAGGMITVKDCGVELTSPLSPFELEAPLLQVPVRNPYPYHIVP